jgi:spermidine synthase
MAAGAALAHRHTPIERALVIGAGVGISSVSLAGIDGISVDGYEINQTLKRVLRDYPDGTLHSAERDNIHWRWSDARTGLALDDTTYDIILSAPLQLKQAGSSLLLSTEYLRLVKSRLAPGGVLAIYSFEGEPEQAWLIQRTIAEHFKHRVSWARGTVTIASDQPIELTQHAFDLAIARPDKLFGEMRALDGRLRAEGAPAGLFGWYDGETAFPVMADQLITDDWPLVEYPAIAHKLVHAVPRNTNAENHD